MLLRFYFIMFPLFFFHLSYSQENIIDETNYEKTIKHSENYKTLILKGNVYKKMEGIEKSFSSVNKIILTDVNDLILPKSFSDYPVLKELIIANSYDVNLKSNINIISKLKKLIHLEITNCKITCIPKNLNKFNQTLLERLSFSNNDIKRVPRNISKLSIEVLDLSNNKIKEKELLNLSKNKEIKELFLDYCQLKAFPSLLGEMKNLKVLSITFNKISSIDSKLTGFKALELISLTGNPIEKLDVNFIDNNNSLIVDFVKR